MSRLRLIAVAALAALAAWTAFQEPSSADEVPAGWKRDDYIAYLILSDYLRDMSKDSNEIFVACISNRIGTDQLFTDPSPKLLNALTTVLADRAGVKLRRASQCDETTGEVRERKSGAAAMYVWADESKPDPLSPETPNGCGEYEVDWHHAGLWGGGAYYHLNDTKSPIEVERDTLCFIAE